MDRGTPSLRRATRRSRVRSPSAANAGAGSKVVLRLDMDGNVLRLQAPAFIVFPQCSGAPIRWDGIEPRLDDSKPRAAGDLLEVKLDERGGRGGELVIVSWVARMRPAQREQVRFVHTLDRGAPLHVLVTLEGNAPGRDLPHRKGPVEGDPEPGPELFVIGHRVPYTLDRGRKLNGFLDSICHTQPIGCP